MTQKALVLSNFEGGMSTDLKVGPSNSQAYVQGFDFRTSPSQLALSPGLMREDVNVVKDLIQNSVMINDGTVFALGSTGLLYKRRSSGVQWSSEGVMDSGTFGMDYRFDTDSIYMCNTKTVSSLTNASAANSKPFVLQPSYYNISYSQYNNSSVVGFNVSAYQTGSAFNYTPLTAINESQPNRRFFQSDIEPLNKISIYVNGKGSGAWTLTLHDGNDKVLGSATITNGNMKSSAWNDFVFTAATNGQVRIYIAPNARTYHIHVTSTVADGTMSTAAQSDMSQCDLQVWADRLVQTNSGIHPIERFQQFEAIGNGNYLSIWEPINLGVDPTTMTSGPNQEWQQHKLVFPMEYEVCGLALQNEFLVIAAERTTTGNNTPQDGILFFWDGLSPTYNYFVRIPEGSPQAISENENVLYYFANGSWYSITGPTSTPIKIRSMPGSEQFGVFPVRVNPYAATVRRGIHLMAYPSVSSNSALNFGVYSWGSVDKNYAESFGYSYAISTGSQSYSVGNNLTIGMVKSFGDILLVSWRDTTGGGYGIDSITIGLLGPSAIWQSLIFDNGYPARQKTAIYMDVYYNLDPTGIHQAAGIQMAYSINRGAWVTDPNIYDINGLWQGQQGYARFSIGPEARFNEIQLQVYMNNGGATIPPVIYSVSLVYDDNSAEKLF